MRLRNGVAIFGAALAVSVLAVRNARDPAAITYQTETERIVQQLARVAESMRAAPQEDLTAAQRSARAETLRWLDEYRHRGVFPHNHVRLESRTPVFIDPHGTPCAVAYLLLRSGEAALVEDVVRTANLGRVPELAADPRLRTWFASRGITEEEAARIQPTYGGMTDDSGVSSYVGATVGFSLLTAALGSYSLMSSRPTGSLNAPRLLSAVGLLGHAALVVGAVGARDAPSTLAVLTNFAGGIVSGVLVAGPFAPSRDAAGAGASPLAVTPLVGLKAQRVTLGVTIRR